MEEKIKEIVSQEDFTEKLLACETPEQVQAFTENKAVRKRFTSRHSSK